MERIERIHALHRILSAARDLFSRQGYEPTSIDQVASTAKVAKSSVFAHFGDKANLLAALGLAEIEKLAEAARDLGAGEWLIFRDIMVPHMVPGLVAGALLAFTLSLDDFVITFFTSGPDTITFPIKVYSMVRFSVTPAVNAASTLLILLTAGLTALALWLQGADIATQAA